MAITTLTAIAGGLAAAGGIAGAISQMSASERAAAIQDKNVQQWLSVHIPDPEEQKIALEHFVSAGKLVPKLETAVNQNPSEFMKVAAPQAYKESQMRSLNQLQDISDKGGQTLQDKANLQKMKIDSQAEQHGDLAAINDSAARRGAGGSGMAAALQLANAQSANDRESNNQLNVAAQSKQRALDAIIKGGDLASQYRTQDVGEQQAKASAADAINRFNTQNMQTVQQRNIDAQNQSQATNLANAQDIANKNTTTSQTQETHNKGLAQQNFENQMAKASGISNAYTGQANQAQQAGQATANTLSNVGGSLAGVANSAQNFNVLKDYLDKKEQKTGLAGGTYDAAASTA